MLSKTLNMTQTPQPPLDKTVAGTGPHHMHAAVQVGLADRSYPIWIGEGLLGQPDIWRDVVWMIPR